jgi:hypothetical protein
MATTKVSCLLHTLRNKLFGEKLKNRLYGTTTEGNWDENISANQPKIINNSGKTLLKVWAQNNTQF